MKRLFVLIVCLCVACNGRGCPLKKKFDDGGSEGGGWGAVTDPDGDCGVAVQGNRVMMTVPNTPHDLNPGRGLNAPRVMQEVKGDFVVTVKVTCDLEPDNGFVGAGLLVWADERNFVRLERNRYTVPGQNRLFCYPPLFEYFKNGVYQNTDPLPTDGEFFLGPSTWLRLERRETQLRFSSSHDGRDWQEGYTMSVALPSRVQVGVAAVNTSQRPFTVTFEDFALDPK